MCGTMNGVVNWCSGNFAPSGQGPAPTPTPPQSPTPLPTSPTPPPPSGGSCSYGLEACRAAARKLHLDVRGFAWYPFEGHYEETGCYAYKNGFWKDYAWYGLRADGQEGQKESDLSAIAGDRFRIEGTHNCVATPSPTPSPPSSACEDLNQDCATFEAYRYCTGQYATWMAANCKKSCGLCGAACADDYAECETWGSYRYCLEGQYVSWMHQYCKRTCGTCALQARSQKPRIAPEGAPESPPNPASGDDDQLLSASWHLGPGFPFLVIIMTLDFFARQ